MRQTDLIQTFAEQRSLAPICLQHIRIIALIQCKPGADSLLQRGRRTDGQKIVHLLDTLRHLRRRDCKADTPAGDRKGFGQRVAGDRAFIRAGQRGRHHMGIGWKHNMLIDLVGHHEGVIFLRQRLNQRQLLPCEYLAAGIGRIADDDSLGALPEGVLQHFRVKLIVRRNQRYI